MKTTSDKARATINNWTCVWGPHGEPLYLFGEVSNHPNQQNFRAPVQATSSIVRADWDKKEVETQNTIYTLGDKMQ